MLQKRRAKSTGLGLATLLVVCVLSAPAAILPAQGVRSTNCISAAEPGLREIRVGTCVRSTLGSNDAITADGVHYEDHRLNLKAGEAVRIDLDATGAGRFDTYLEVRRPGAATPLMENDDRADPPGSLNSSLIFAPPAAGDYVVRARALSVEMGDYVLRVTPAPVTRVREIQLGGATATSRLNVSNPVSGGRYYEEYRLLLRAGEVVRIDMEVTRENAVGEIRFDPYLAIFAPGQEVPLEMNDDRGDSLNARLIFTAPVAGVYRVRAQGYNGSTGAYSLATARLPAMPQPDMLAGDRAEGRWFVGSPATERNGRPVRYMEYRLEGTARERLQIDAGSNPVPNLMLGRGDRAWFAEANGIGNSARLSAVLPVTGTYIVRVEVPVPRVGTFRLRLTRLADAPLGDPPRLDRGQPVQGRLGLDSGLILRERDAGQVVSFYRIYALPVQAGETIVVTLDSVDFDPVLDAGTMSILGYTVALTNNDSNGRNSRLELHPTGPDTVYLRARSLLGEIGEGRFTLRVVEGTESIPAPPR